MKPCTFLSLPLLLAAALAAASASCTTGTRECLLANHVAPDLSTPQKALAAFYDEVEAEDFAATRAILTATTKTGVALADDYALLYTTTHRSYRVLSQKLPDYKPFFWERGSIDQVVKGLREQIAELNFTIDGDHAAAARPGGPTQMAFLRNGKTWQIDFDHVPGFESYPLNGKAGDTPAMTYLLARYCPALEAVTTDVCAGKITTTEQAKAALEKLTNPIQARVEKELSDLQAKEKPAP